MPACPDPRAEVARQLTALSAPEALLHRDSAESTQHRYPINDTDRARFRRRTIDWYLGLQDPPRDGRSAIISAGPPAAGKTTMLRNRIADVEDYRIIDADIIKDHIIEQALTDGIYGHMLVAVQLADGHPLSPRELSALVHEESVGLADQIRRVCLVRKENVVIEGTLTWHGRGPTIFRELADNDYTDVDVYGIEIDRGVAHEQALNRWWKRRTLWAAGQDLLGGRFTPPTPSTSATRPPAVNRYAPPTRKHSSTMRFRLVISPTCTSPSCGAQPASWKPSTTGLTASDRSRFRGQRGRSGHQGAYPRR